MCQLIKPIVSPRLDRSRLWLAKLISSDYRAVIKRAPTMVGASTSKVLLLASWMRCWVSAFPFHFFTTHSHATRNTLIVCVCSSVFSVLVRVQVEFVGAMKQLYLYIFLPLTDKNKQSLIYFQKRQMSALTIS